MKKFKIFFDIEKEEKWLNSMLQDGWECNRINALGFYTFKKNSDIEKIIRLDFQKHLNKKARENYIQIHEEFGWHAIKPNSINGTYYWLKPKDGHDELFSDNLSHIAKYKRLMKSIGSSAIFYLAFLIILYTSYDYPLFYDVKGAYLTPGLWDKDGTSFIFAFLFETPFALMRFLIPWLFIFMSLFYGLTYLRYRKALQQLS